MTYTGVSPRQWTRKMKRGGEEQEQILGTPSICLYIDKPPLLRRVNRRLNIFSLDFFFVVLNKASVVHENLA